MRYRLEIETKDITAVHQLLAKYCSHPVVQTRQVRNVDGPAHMPNREEFWAAHLMCLLTTQNKSGSESTIGKFLRLQPFPLAYEACRSDPDVDNLISKTLSKLGIRRWITISDFAQENFRRLEDDGWIRLDAWASQLVDQRAKLPENEHYLAEREISQCLQEVLRGIGPKQSRNFWQYLGLTRYEIPLDSRVMRWLNEQLSFYVPSGGLADEWFYCQVLDAMRELAARSGVLPCIMDAAIFASMERQ